MIFLVITRPPLKYLRGLKANCCLQRYLRSWSTLAYFLPSCLILLAILERSLSVGQNFWLSIWTDATAAKTAQNERLNNAYYLGIYFALGILPVLVQVMPWTMTKKKNIYLLSIFGGCFNWTHNYTNFHLLPIQNILNRHEIMYLHDGIHLELRN